MFASRSSVILRRAPDYYSKNVFEPPVTPKKEKRSPKDFELDETPYSIRENIGVGAFGIVCKAIDKRSEKEVAIKKVHDAYKSQSSAKCALREIRILRELSHSNIITISDVFITGKGLERDVYLVMNLMETDLNQVLKSDQDLREDHFKYFFYQIICGLKYIHSAGIIHRDLKPSNLLLNADCLLKIGDFGMARSGPSSKTSPNHSSGSGHLSQYVSTLWYRAPEILLSMGEYDTKVDIWSAGCIFAEMLLRREIFPGDDTYSQIKKIIDCLGTPERQAIKKISSPSIRDYIVSLGQKSPRPFSSLFPNASSEARDLVSSILQISPWNRHCAEEVLAHPFLSKWHNVQKESVCSDKVQRDLLNIEKYEGDMIIRGLDEEAKRFESRRGGIELILPEPVAPKKSFKQIIDKILFRENLE
uniref:mitogen-activated protein kinase n=1 Tax=Caenorhabditis tropicalis TaxID=1561998 RepID=A0A1I7ULM4_9PELO